MRIMNIHKQLEYDKGLFTYRVLNKETPEYVPNLCAHPPSHYSNSRDYHLSSPMPRIDIIIQNKYSLHSLEPFYGAACL